MALMILVPCRSTVGGYLASLRLLGVHLFRFDIGCGLIPASMRRLQGGTVRISVCGRAVEHYAAMALMKRSPKITANWALAMVHSRGGIFHSFSDLFKIR